VNVYAARRQQLMEKIGPRAVAIIGGKKLSVRNSDVEHRFRQTSDLWYLTGFTEPEALAVIAPGRPEKYTLFVRARDPERETWTGRRAGLEGAKAKFGADQAFAISDVAHELPKLLDGVEEILYVPGEDGELDELVLSTLAHLRQAERRGMRAPRRISDLRWTLHELRLLKDADALAKMRRAVEVTRAAHTAAMRAARDGVREYEIEALIDYTFRKNNGHPGYGTIVGGGVNATILHYVDNDQPLKTFEHLAQKHNLMNNPEAPLIVAAAGNDRTDRPFWPAAFDWVVGVGSLDRDDTVSDFSDHGDWVDIYALGRDHVNAFPTGTYTCYEPPNVGQVRQFKNLAKWSGTSFSTPLISGLLAGIMTEHGLTAREAWLRMKADAIVRTDPKVGKILTVDTPGD